MVKSKFFLVMATLSLSALLISACASQPSPTPATELKDSKATEARDAALAYLRGNESENAPSADIVWEERNVTPRGVAEVRGETIEFTSAEWTITVSYPLPLQEDTEYDVVVSSTDYDWHWSGTVKADGSVTEFDPFKQPNKEKSRVVAEEFLRKSPTFANSGIEDTLRLTDTKTPMRAFCWVFIFEFDSRHAGYGDTNGQAVAEVITPHLAEILVQGFEVASAVIDDKWDMIKQELISD
ncbi:MAG: hypothetical protein JSV32_03615 [Dehalococcoidia bacterium]|nr:MAG: hypothetical protein JSV32_03615 [Dehalococcoidia bacterium]